MPGEAPIEPSRFAQPIESSALRFLPEIDEKAAAEAPVFIDAAEDLDPDEDELHMLDAADAPAEEEELKEAPEDDNDMGADAEEGEAEDDAQDGAEDGEAVASEEVEEEGEEAAEDAAEVDSQAVSPSKADSPGKADSPSKVHRRPVHRFKVVVGRCSILEAPNAVELMALSKNKVLQMKQEFISDAVFWAKDEQRFYLRLTRGRGWVCEQTRNDIRKMAVLPCSRRKQPISKKMAKAVAFRGGDTGGMTKLRKDDLIRNKYGKIVSKKASEAAAKRVRDGVGIGKWTKAVKRARDELGLTGFIAVKKGTAVYAKAQEYYKEAAQK